MNVICKYYQLKEKKFMEDGNFISAKQKLLYICTEENLMQFETFDETYEKKIFWASENEVKLLEELHEEWTEEEVQQQQDEINSNWLII